MTAPETLTEQHLFAATENYVAVAKIREWCNWANSMVCSHGGGDCERCEALEDYAAAVLALLPPVDDSPKT